PFSAPMLLNRVSRCRARHERELLAGLAPSTRCAEMDFAGLTKYGRGGHDNFHLENLRRKGDRHLHGCVCHVRICANDGKRQ
ncbi:hypothetical protein LXT12_26220, partial [Pelomonas sp. P7]